MTLEERIAYLANCSYFNKRKKIAKKKIKRHEQDLQKSVVKYLEERKVPFYHIPNGGFRKKLEAIILRICGVQSGVPDLHICVRNAKYGALYIELKSPTGKLTAQQYNWIQMLNKNGYLAVVHSQYEECISEIERYLDGVLFEQYVKIVKEKKPRNLLKKVVVS